MRPEVQSQLTHFCKRLPRRPNRRCCLITTERSRPSIARRDQAYPYPGVALVLQEIVRNGRTRVVVISGRDATDVLPLLNIHPRPEVWGVHGLQRLKTDGSMDMPHLDERTLDGLSDADRWLGYQQLRHAAEFKAGSIAVHWRGLSENDAEDLRARVLLGWRRIAERAASICWNSMAGWRFAPAPPTKAMRFACFSNEIGPHAPVAYLGDDATDESAFQALQGRGLSVLVRPTWRTGRRPNSG